MATIAEEISALRERISGAYDVINQKGGDVPFDRTSWNLSASIDSIRTGDADPAAIVPVRYLKSTGTQYIDTVRYFTSTNNGNEARIEFDFQMDNLTDTTRILGVINPSNSLTYQCGVNGGADPKLYVGWGTANPVNGFPADTLRHKVVMDTRSNQVWLDGQLSSFTYTSYATIFQTVYLFARNNGNQPDRFAKGRIYRYRHLQNENIMRDLIPARIGAEGVMYDINTGQILHNQGTGDFEYGLDVIPALRDAVQVQYIQFSGTQGIDTGLHGTQNTRCDMVFQGVGQHSLTTPEFMFGARNTATAGSFNMFASTTMWNIDIATDTSGLKRLQPAYTSNYFTDPSHCCIAAEQRSVTGQRVGAKAIDKTVVAGTFTTDTTMRIGLKPTSGYADTINNFSGRFWGGQIWEGTTLVRDFVPCRIGTTGYLYDRVSQTLFSNIGTGDFGLGPDID